VDFLGICNEEVSAKMLENWQINDSVTQCIRGSNVLFKPTEISDKATLALRIIKTLITDDGKKQMILFSNHWLSLTQLH